MRERATYGVVCAPSGPVPSVGAKGDRTTSFGGIEGVTVGVFVGTDESAIAVTLTNCRSPGEREQRQGKDDHSGGEDHVERCRGKEIR